MIWLVVGWAMVMAGGLALFAAIVVALTPRDERGPEDRDDW